ncbi:hypothetical protein [Streptosporangium sp. KLBMP 9127]|nr:hypothetical protein [Streptosporangium sp. KLBMP 9127]
MAAEALLAGARRELSARLIVLGQAASGAGFEIPAEARGVVLERLREERARQYERLAGEVRGLADDAGRYMAKFAGSAMVLVGDVLSKLHGVMLSERSRSEQCVMVLDVVKLTALVLDGPRWRFWIRLKAWLALQRVLAGLEGHEAPGAVAVEGGTA